MQIKLENFVRPMLIEFVVCIFVNYSRKRVINLCAVGRRLGENESTFGAWQIPWYLKMLNW